jgi:hypothetical protein
MRLLFVLAIALLLSGCPVDDVVARSRCADAGCPDAR